MNEIKYDKIGSNLQAFAKRLGWADYSYTFTLGSSWLDPNTVRVREETPNASHFHQQYRETGIRFSMVEHNILVTDIPTTFTVAELLKNKQKRADNLIGELMSEIGWKSALCITSFSYGGGLGFTAFMSFEEELTGTKVEQTISQFCPLVRYYNTWARQILGEHEQGSMLSRREIECLMLVSRGFTSKAIADLLFITKNTVDFHIKNSMEKLGVKTRSEAIFKFAKLSGPDLISIETGPFM